MEKVRILLDTDLGDDTDDAAALMLALARPEMEIVGITTVFKNVEKRAEMVRDMLKLYGREDIPVCPGYGKALVERRFDVQEEPIQYAILKENTKNVSSMKADDFILQQVKKDKNLVILAMGCMTNLAMACLRETELMRTVKIIGMGGAFQNACPEWNILCDPEAAYIVAETCENLIMMGLDVTKYLGIDAKRLQQWKQYGNEKMQYFLEGVRMFCEKTGYPVTFHDVLLTAYLIDPQVVTLKRGDFTVELSGTRTRGTMVDQSNYYEIDPKAEKGLYYAECVDLERFFRIIDRDFAQPLMTNGLQ